MEQLMRTRQKQMARVRPGFYMTSAIPPRAHNAPPVEPTEPEFDEEDLDVSGDDVPGPSAVANPESSAVAKTAEFVTRWLEAAGPADVGIDARFAIIGEDPPERAMGKSKAGQFSLPLALLGSPAKKAASEQSIFSSEYVPESEPPSDDETAQP